VALADPARNAAEITRLYAQAADHGASLALFPELSQSGYSLDDQHQQDVLLGAVHAALEDLVRSTAERSTLLVVGAPLRLEQRLFNCAVVAMSGRVLGVAPKSYLPGYREFYEERQFAAARDALVDVIVQRSEQLRRIVDDLRLVTELDDPATIDCSPEPTAIESVLERLLAQGLRSADDRMRVQLRVPSGIRSVHADPVRLQTVLGCLLDNACRFAPPGSAIHVDAWESDDRITVRIVDCGPGVPLRERERVFEKFHRADAMQRNGVSGTGLGLYVARRLLDAMQGRVWLEDGPRGTGLAACVELPVSSS
jgi:signal transduction histidine kinase